MKKSKRVYPIVNLGTSFFLLIFIVLCLVTFAVLSLSSALRDQELEQKTAGRNALYYEANGQAEEQLAKIVEEFLVSGRTEDSVSYDVSITETQMLHVECRLNSACNLTEGYYQITQWRVISTEKWEEKSTLPVFGSN